MIAYVVWNQYTFLLRKKWLNTDFSNIIFGLDVRTFGLDITTIDEMLISDGFGGYNIINEDITE